MPDSSASDTAEVAALEKVEKVETPEAPEVPMHTHDGFEKSPMQSKKFIAYLIADLGWLGLLVAMLLLFRGSLTILEWGMLMGTVIVKAFVQVGMLLGQSSLDKFVRVARINASMGIPTQLGKSRSRGEDE